MPISDSRYFHNETRSVGYLGHGREGIGERNFGYDSLKSRLNRDIEETWIVPRDCCPGFSPPWLLSSGAQAAVLRKQCPGSRAPAAVLRQQCPDSNAPEAGLRRETNPGNNRGQQSLSPPSNGSIWTSGSQSQSSGPPIPSQPWPR